MTQFERRVRDWTAFHRSNPILWEHFEDFALKAIEKGHTKLSPWFIMNIVRWETDLYTTEKGFKISNNRIAFYSRYFLAKHPEFEHFFNVKRMRGETDLVIEDFKRAAAQGELNV
jgi:hypothetical protein